MKWVESLVWGVRECAVLAMGGGESARAKGGAWERVVEDGELVDTGCGRSDEEVPSIARPPLHGLGPLAEGVQRARRCRVVRREPGSTRGRSQFIRVPREPHGGDHALNLQRHGSCCQGSGRGHAV